MSFIETEIELPSKGIFYEDGLDTLRIRNLSTGDEQKIYGSTSNATTDDALSNCVVEPEGFNINTLVSGDKFFFMVKERIHTYGSMYKQPFYCIHCNREGIVEYDLDDMEIKYLDPSKIKLPLRIKLPINKDEIELRILNCENLQSIAKRAKKQSNTIANKTSPKEIEFLLKTARQVAKVNGKEIAGFEAEKYVRNLHSQDRAYINSAYKKIVFGYDERVEVTCPLCGQTLYIPFEMCGEFFNPSMEVEFL